jgi:ABC-type maltose transport system permease subunit
MLVYMLNESYQDHPYCYCPVEDILEEDEYAERAEALDGATRFEDFSLVILPFSAPVDVGRPIRVF